MKRYDTQQLLQSLNETVTELKQVREIRTAMLEKVKATLEQVSALEQAKKS
ncbi:hypothetical protein [Eisenibacter elegans]|jgi:uncharacterized protein YlbG (UPF0298 family)|uniref:hypothetical protein n=1 Tax=Eisenibacter elegans TaxID=997 RepID=UPI00042651C0|nr:hypothetical protein [Eisenibacter elegans]